jgi:hypothetical protein
MFACYFFDYPCYEYKEDSASVHCRDWEHIYHGYVYANKGCEEYYVTDGGDSCGSLLSDGVHGTYYTDGSGYVLNACGSAYHHCNA